MPYQVTACACLLVACLALGATPLWAQVGASGAPASDTAEAIPLQHVSAAIHVQPGQTCLDEARLQRRVARWLERDTVDARIWVDVFGGEGPRDVRFVVRRLGEEPAHRKLQSVPEPCDQLHAAVALSVALAIDATLLDAGDPPAEQALAPPEADPVEAGSPLLPPPPEGPNAYQPRASVGAGAGLTSGMVPGQGPAAALMAGFSPVRWLELRVGGLATMANGLNVPNVPGGYSAWIAVGQLQACALTHASEGLLLTTCVGAELGGFGSRGSDGFPGGGAPPATTRFASVLAGVSGEVRVHGRLSLALDLSLHAPLQSRRIEVTYPDGRPAAFTELSLLSLSATLGPVYRFDLR